MDRQISCLSYTDAIANKRQKCTAWVLKTASLRRCPQGHGSSRRRGAVHPGLSATAGIPWRVDVSFQQAACTEDSPCAAVSSQHAYIGTAVLD